MPNYQIVVTKANGKIKSRGRRAFNPKELTNELAYKQAENPNYTVYIGEFCGDVLVKKVEFK